MSNKQYFFDSEKNIKRVIQLLYLCCAVLFVLDFIIDRYSKHPLEPIWGFYPIYGFIGCVVLVIVAKWMRKVVMRDEDYYQNDTAGSDQENKV